MSSALYPKAAQKFGEAVFDWVSHDIRLALMGSGYTYSVAHEFYSDLSDVIGTPVSLAGKTNTSGVYDADDVTFVGLTGSAVYRGILYKWTGAAGTSPLIFYIDSDRAVALPFTPNGLNFVWQFDNGPNKIFKLEVG